MILVQGEADNQTSVVESARLCAIRRGFRIH